jgi:hypothetical protein
MAFGRTRLFRPKAITHRGAIRRQEQPHPAGGSMSYSGGDLGSERGIGAGSVRSS